MNLNKVILVGISLISIGIAVNAQSIYPGVADVKSLKQTGPLTFMTADGLTVEPLYDVHRERYGVYWKQ